MGIIIRLEYFVHAGRVDRKGINCSSLGHYFFCKQIWSPFCYTTTLACRIRKGKSFVCSGNDEKCRMFHLIAHFRNEIIISANSLSPKGPLYGGFTCVRF